MRLIAILGLLAAIAILVLQENDQPRPARRR